MIILISMLVGKLVSTSASRTSDRSSIPCQQGRIMTLTSRETGLFVNFDILHEAFHAKNLESTMNQQMSAFTLTNNIAVEV